MICEQVPGAGRHRRHEPCLIRQLELARVRTTSIAARIGKMSNRKAESLFQNNLAFDDLTVGCRHIVLGEHQVSLCVGHDGYIWLQRERLEYLPAQAQCGDARVYLDAGTCHENGYDC